MTAKAKHCRSWKGILAFLVVASIADSAFAAQQRSPKAKASAERQAPTAKNQDETNAFTFGVAKVPKPAFASRKELPLVFSKPVPDSIADLKAMEQHLKSLIRRVSPAVVAVEVGTGSGSGVIISSDGLVLTAGHVCGAANRTVRFTFPDGSTARGRTLGVDRESDTGLMRITTRGPWPHVPVGDLEETRLGDWVLALGHPGGFDLKRSLVVRSGRIVRLSPGVVQTDCTISPGDSGGPLFDMHGRVIGIHSAISSSFSENFHVAISEFYDAWDQLANVDSGRIQVSRGKPFIGASVVADPQGCRVDELDNDGPALKAGLRVGDIVVRIEEREVKVPAAFRRWVEEAQPGEVLNLEVKRADKVLSFRVTLQSAPRGN